MDWKNEEIRYCSEYVYSEQYLNFIIRYNNAIDLVYERFTPECVNIINSQYLIAYTRDDLIDINSRYKYGYQFVPKCYGLMDTSVIYEIGADRVSRLPGLGLTGKDVLIGVIDTGIDYTMDVFKNSDGSSKIQYIWDQTVRDDDTVSAFGYGRVYSKKEIDDALKTAFPYMVVPENDENGHGTFMASIAAGTENALSDFSGIAPNAELVIVKLKEVKDNLREFYGIKKGVPCYGEDDIMLALRFLIDTVVMLRKPMIIMLGIGTNQGDHNGNSVLEDYITLICSQRGIGVCIAAGNELGRAGHFRGNSGETIELSVGEDGGDFSMEIWGNAPGILNLELISPTGERFANINPYENSGVLKRFLYEGTVVYIENILTDRLSGNQLYFIRFYNAVDGIWKIKVDEMINSDGSSFDAWLPIYDFRAAKVEFISATPDITVCGPGNCLSAITVAAADTRNATLYTYSSRGYTRDERIKPDIVSPGVAVYGAYKRISEKDLFIKRSGTSVASAVTAGAMALIMEWAIVKKNNINITNAEIKQMLIRGADRKLDLVYPNKQWGWGALDVYGVFNALRR